MLKAYQATKYRFDQQKPHNQIQKNLHHKSTDRSFFLLHQKLTVRQQLDIAMLISQPLTKRQTIIIRQI